MSNELRCPHCGKAFEVDEAGYAGLVSQVRTKEFDKQLEEYKQHLAAEVEASRKADRAEAEKEADELRAKIAQADNEKRLAVAEAVAEKEKELSSEKENSLKQISELTGKLEQAETKQKLAVAEALAEKERELSTEKEKSQQEISSLKLQLTTQKAELEGNAAKEAAEKEREWSEKLAETEKQLEYYKDLKLKMSTKMVGESLERHCEDEYNMYLRPLLPNAYFEKDNEVSATGSKGDFIYREELDGVELLSIMFEMKNEMDTTENKHKNEFFLRELDKDRKEKKCEYAVLCTLLEADNDYYNQGIVSAYKFDKMFIIRPQFMVPLITLLRNAALNAHTYKKQLDETRRAELDVTNFETKLGEFKDRFSKRVEFAENKFDEVIAMLDKTADDIQKAKEALLVTKKHMGIAENALGDLTIRKLTYQNPTMKALFKAAGEILDVESEDLGDADA